jgi:hypothetical protein
MIDTNAQTKITAVKITVTKTIVLKKLFNYSTFCITRPLPKIHNFRVCIFISVAVLCLTSCKKHELPIQQPVIKIDSINRGYLLGKDNMHTGVNIDLKPECFCFKYDGQNNFKVRTGGFLTNHYSTGSYLVFMPDLYDTVEYSKNKIDLIRKSGYPGIAVNENRRTYIFANGKIQMKIAYTSAQETDTTLYFYGTDQLLDKVVEKFGGQYTIKNFSFNSSGNLDSISGKTYYSIDNTLLSTTQETFGNYDSSTNPLKGFGIWDETFYRSLTKNNFRSYHFETRNVPGNYIEQRGDFKFNLQYDSNGVVDFAK